jgi:hypothetical protein
MKNLYKIIFKHYAPKDSECGIKCLVLAKDATDIYEWLKTNPKVGNNTSFDYLFTGWGDAENKYADDGVDFKQKMLDNNGQIDDPDYDYSDAYYGITLYGWRLLKENVTTDYQELKNLSILIEI